MLKSGTPAPFPGRTWGSLGITHRSADFLIRAFRRLRPSHSTESAESQAGESPTEPLGLRLHNPPRLPPPARYLWRVLKTSSPPARSEARPACLYSSPRRSTKPPKANSESSISDAFGRLLMSSWPRRRSTYVGFHH